MVFLHVVIKRILGMGFIVLVACSKIMCFLWCLNVLIKRALERGLIVSAACSKIMCFPIVVAWSDQTYSGDVFQKQIRPRPAKCVVCLFGCIDGALFFCKFGAP